MALFGCLATIVLFVAVLLNLLKSYCKILAIRATPTCPPGPTPLPILGNLGTLIFSEKRAEENLIRWRQKYGTAFAFFNCNHPVVVISDEGIWRELYTSPKLAERDGSQLMRFLQKDGILFGSGKEWMERRKLAFGGLHFLGLGNKDEHQVTDVVRSCRKKYFLQLRSAEEGAEIDLRHITSECIFEIMWRLIFGSTKGMEDQTFRLELLDSFDAFFSALCVSHQTRLGDLFPDSKIVQAYLCKLTKAGRTWKNTQRRLQDCIWQTSKDLERETCFIDFWQKKCGDTETKALTETCSEFMVTVVEQAAAFMWIIAELSKASNKETLLKLRTIGQELGEIEATSSSDSNEKPLRDSAVLILLETLVQIGLTPISLGRRTISELKIPMTSFTIPADAGVLYLKPDRSLGHGACCAIQEMHNQESTDERIRKLKTKLFGIGKRHCLGQQLVILELVEFILPVLCNFEFIFQDDQAGVSEHGSALFIKSPAQCWIKSIVK